MFRFIKIFFALGLIIYTVPSFGQDFQVILHETFKYDTLGDEIVFDFEVVNISPDTQDVFEKRVINILPDDWTSSLCFGEQCYSSEVDSIATNINSPNPPLGPQDTLITSLHIQTLNNMGTAYVTLEIGLVSNPNNRQTVNFVATTDPSVGVENENSPGDYFLEQNYPNPFNPSTKINYGLKEAGHVTLKIYNILGVEVVSLIDKYQTAGNYEINFPAGKLSSGIYIYRLVTNNFVQTRKMILEK